MAPPTAPIGGGNFRSRRIPLGDVRIPAYHHGLTTTYTTMGDKSPKSKQKDKNQKQSKAAASEKNKQAITSKQQERSAVPKKK